MYKLALYCFVLVFCVPACYSQHFNLLKSCGSYNVSIVKNFDAKEYMGKWYEYARYYAIFQNNLGCVTADYSLQDNGDVKVVNKGRNVKSKEWTDIEGKAVPADKSGDAKLTVTFTGVPVGAPYWVLDTDYENYSVVWACSFRAQFLWILLRRLDDYPKFESTIKTVLINAGISEKPLTVTQNDKELCGDDFGN